MPKIKINEPQSKLSGSCYYFICSLRQTYQNIPVCKMCSPREQRAAACFSQKQNSITAVQEVR